MPANDDRLQFLAEWFDERASMPRLFTLSFFVDDSSVELYEPKVQRVFLRRSHVPGLGPDDLYVGGRVDVFGRQVAIADYADELTRRLCSQRAQRTFAMVKPDGVPNLGKILHALALHGLRVTRARMVRLDKAFVERFYQEHCERPFFPALVEYITSGPVVGLELMGREAVVRWRELMGPTDAEAARQDAPDSLRALYGADKTNNALHGSDSEAAAERELELFYPAAAPERPPSSAELSEDCTCAVIKPHIVRDGLLGQLVAALQAADADLGITGLELLHLSPARARHFLAPYQGAVPEYHALATELSAGPAVALALRWPCQGAEAVDAFRAVAGPRDPAVAALLRPGSLRAQFGRDKVRNALHCTDLSGDGPVECQELFGPFTEL